LRMAEIDIGLLGQTALRQDGVRRHEDTGRVVACLPGVGFGQA
jgi:hypothetical protein